MAPLYVQVLSADGARRRLAAALLVTPVLLVVGGADSVVIGLNEQARALMQTRVEIAIVPGATHLFEEPGTLEEVARLAANWFVSHLTPP